MKSPLIKILAFVFLLMFLCSGWCLYQIYSEYKAAEVQYENLEQYVSAPSASPPEHVRETGKDRQAGPEPEPLLCPQVDFNALYEINPEIVGWLIIEGTRINYPIVQGQNNEFFLTHQFDGQYSSAGCLFLDAKNDASFQEFNQIIYGHYMKNQSMFHDLVNYKDQAFFDGHPTGWLITPSAAYSLHFFSGYVSDVFGEAWKTEFIETEHLEWLRKCKEQSCFYSDVVPEADSRVLTLSTCSYEFQNARFVLHAVLQIQCSNDEINICH